MDYDYDGINNAAESDASLAEATDANNDGYADINDNFDSDGDGNPDIYDYVTGDDIPGWNELLGGFSIVGTMESFSLIELDAAIVQGQRAHFLLTTGGMTDGIVGVLKDSYTPENALDYPTEEDYEFYLRFEDDGANIVIGGSTASWFIDGVLSENNPSEISVPRSEANGEIYDVAIDWQTDGTFTFQFGNHTLQSKYSAYPYDMISINGNTSYPNVPKRISVFYNGGPNQPQVLPNVDIFPIPSVNPIIPGFSLHSGSLEDNNTINQYSSVDLTNVLEVGERLIIDKAWYDNYILPALQADTDNAADIFIGILSGDESTLLMPIQMTWHGKINQNQLPV